MNETTHVSRRSLIKGGLVAGAALVAGGSFLNNEKEAFAAPGDKQYGFLVEASKCTNCLKCVNACRKANKTPQNLPARRKITAYKREGAKDVYVTTSCMHCENPSCAQACPAGAITKRDDGIVVVDQDRCIGCKYCYFACPFAVPKYTSDGMDKCDCCIGAGVAAGEQPNCAKACEFGALNYGEMKELEAKFRNAKRLDAPTNPSFLLA
ncbi:MAG: 4Fe-4S binding protein [Coriobacteriia bacterium]|nr:4Fe-4S binding protein [Coriobacteriia bacterium]